MAHTHPVVDGDSRFVINSTTRVISTTSDKLELIQGDHQSERITFEIPKIVEGHDMSLCDRIEIHYINIDRRTSATSRDVYIADDAAVDSDKLTFSWLISGNATKYYGRLNFIILFECLDPDGNYTYKWNTEICKLLTIGEGISNTSSVIEDHSDILEKFRNEILEEAGEKSTRPDWNQNDETAKDYVKNRPGGYDVAIPSTVTLDIGSSRKIVDNKYEIRGFNFVYESSNGYVNVEYDGVLYEKVPVFDPEPPHSGRGFGDQSLVKYPFYFNSSVYLGGGAYSSVAYVTKENPTIKVTSWTGDTVKIPYRYLDVEQADWKETNKLSSSYIKNKPRVVTCEYAGVLSSQDQKWARHNLNVPVSTYENEFVNTQDWHSDFGRYCLFDSSEYVYFVSPNRLFSISITSTEYVCSDEIDIDVNTGTIALKNPTEYIPSPSVTRPNKYVAKKASGNTSVCFVKDYKGSRHYDGKYILDYDCISVEFRKRSQTYSDCFGNYSIIVGNGISPTERSNAHTLDWNGNAWFSGDVYTGSTSGTNRDDGSKKLATVEYVDSQKFSGSYNDLTDVPTIPSVVPFYIDSTTSDYSTTDTVYGNKVKEALLAGRTAWYISSEIGDSGKTITKYTKVSWFNIEKDDTEAKLVVGVGVRSDNNSGAVIFAITT